MMRLLVLDNYDSFTYNLVFLVKELGYGKDMDVIRNDKIRLEEVAKYDKILLSPGPGIPSEAGIMLDLIKEYGPAKSILGICLGHQGIAEAFSARIFNMETVLHGVKTEVLVRIQEEALFRGVPNKFGAGLYHSWAVEPDSVNGQMQVTAVTDQGIIMGISHTKFDVRGLQFHPESVLTDCGRLIMENWLKQ